MWTNFFVCLEVCESKVCNERSTCIIKATFTNKQVYYFGKVSSNKNLTWKQALMLPLIPSTLLMGRYLVVLVHIIKCHDSVMVRCLLQNVLKCFIFHLCSQISIIHCYTWMSWQRWRQFPCACWFTLIRCNSCSAAEAQNRLTTTYIQNVVWQVGVTPGPCNRSNLE